MTRVDPIRDIFVERMRVVHVAALAGQHDAPCPQCGGLGFYEVVGGSYPYSSPEYVTRGCPDCETTGRVSCHEWDTKQAPDARAHANHQRRRALSYLGGAT